MDMHRWDRINSLFDAALELPAEQRMEFLRSQCGDDESLFKEICSLLEEDGKLHSMLDGVALDAAGLTNQLSLEGQTVGPYRMIELLGYGGMGEVYLAERVDGQFEQKVALKVIKLGMDSVQILNRFRHERQILARLQHPHIARLLDGGVSETGRPYFAMEYIEGDPITEYCKTNQLDIDARLSLFQHVCKAVLYAHQNLVVHRDLKPENILVTPKGDVKLLDFGIAKVLEADDTPLTRTGQAIMTPAYASPEQLRREGVSTASDIYSLGVILYELLTGVRPGTTIHADSQQTTEPEKPSTVVTKTGSQEETRSPFTRRLSKKLRGDLDNICLKALRFDPKRRYVSADALAEDIRRHLDGLPVEAQPDSMTYRIGKFVQRHRTSVMIGTATLLGIIFLSSFYTIRLAQERDRAAAEANKAMEIADFLEGLFEVSSPNQSRGETVTARELLDAGADRIESDLEGQPGVQATMMSMIGRVYWQLGLADQAKPLLEQALERHQSTSGVQSPEYTHTLNVLAELWKDRGKYEKALEIHQEALTIKRQVPEPDYMSIAQTLNNLASIQRDQGHYPEAESLFVEAIELRQNHGGTQTHEMSESLNDLAILYNDQGKFDEAETRYRQALAIQEELLGLDHPDRVSTLQNLGTILYDRGELEEAETVMREALEYRRKFFPDGHAQVATSLSSLGLVLQEQGQYDEAEELYLEALEMDRTLLGDDHPYVAYDMGVLATLLFEKGDYDAAEPYYRNSLDMRRRILGERHRSTLNSQNNFAFFLLHTGQPATAEPLFRKNLIMLKEELGDIHPFVGTTHHNLAQARLFQGDPEEAMREVEEAIRIRKEAMGEDNPYVAISVGLRGAILAETGQFEEAEQILLATHEVLNEAFGPQSLYVRDARKRLHQLYTDWDKPEQAASYASEDE